MRAKKRFICIGLLVSVLLLFVGSLETVSCADNEFPKHPINMIIPWKPGGGADMIGRLIGQAIEPILGQKIVVINKAGASATLGVTAVSKAKPDGYTICFLSNPPLTMVPHVLKVNYTLDDFDYIRLVSKGATLFAVLPDFPVKTAKELFEYAKKNKVNYAGDGIGNTSHFACEKVFQAMGVELRLIPYGGGGESIKSLLGGHVDAYAGSVAAAISHVKAGKARGLFVTTASRVKALPGVPGLLDLGIPEAEAGILRGVIGPKGIPADRLAILEEAFKQATESQKVKDFLEKKGEKFMNLSGREFQKIMRSDAAGNNSVAKKLGLSPK